MEKSERKKSINIHSDEKGKVIDKEKISLGENIPQYEPRRAIYRV